MSLSTPSKKLPLLTILGFALLWLASLGFVLEIINLATPKQNPELIDPSFDLLVAAFLLLLTVLGGLFLWRSRRAPRSGDKVVRYLNIATVAIVILLAIVFCSGATVYSANRYYLSQVTHYIRPEPRPDFSLPDFPTPAVAQPTPTHDPNGKYLTGTLVGSIDHLSVGDVFISQSPNNQDVLSLLFSVQEVECLAEKNGTLTTYAIGKSRSLVLGPLTTQDGKIYASQPDAVVQGRIISPDEIMGTVYLRYTDPKTNQGCDLGTFEWDAFVTEK